MPGTLFNTASAEDSRALRRALITFRTDRAKRLGVEPYRIFPNATLELLLMAHPETLEELAAVKGMGPKKIKQFGMELLACLSEASAESKTVSYDEPADAATSGTPLTVGQYLEHVNETLYGQAATVQAELSECNVHSTGCYLTLKDKDGDAVMDAYLTPFLYRSLGVPLEAGLEVKVSGHPIVRTRNGRFSFQIQSLELAGEGSLKKAYELLKKQLEAEGLFARKRPLPEHIERIGVITSRTGAVIGDFRKNLESLGYRLRLYDVRVEGAQAVPNILAGLQWFQKHAAQFDVLVVIRGGGSLEDLQAFNNERVARAIFASALPTIAGIGHDRDVPIASLVADRECSTPSIAAATINQSWQPLRRTLALREQALLHTGEQVIHQADRQLDHAARSLLGVFGRLVSRPAAVARELNERFARAYASCIDRVLEYERNLARMNPERNLQLGYSILRNASGAVIRDARTLTTGEDITARLAHGSAEARITKVHQNDES
jgi:exodeoxyribonuclease VII large subunit